MTGFLLRWLLALVLVFGTYNPTEYCFAKWALQPDRQLSVVVLVGLLLLVGYVIYLRATWRSIGPIGMVLVAALIGAILWVMYDNGLLDLADRGLMTWIALGATAFVLAIGMTWSHVRRAISGQSDVDDVDE